MSPAWLFNFPNTSVTSFARKFPLWNYLEQVLFPDQALVGTYTLITASSSFQGLGQEGRGAKFH